MAKLGPEAMIQKEICLWLNQMDIVYSVTDASLAFGRDGQPRKKINKGWQDITGCMPDGRFLAIEVKSPNGVLSPAQEAHLSRVKENNGIVIVPRSVAEVIAVIESLYGWQDNPKFRRIQSVIRAFNRENVK